MDRIHVRLATGVDARKRNRKAGWMLAALLFVSTTVSRGLGAPVNDRFSNATLITSSMLSGPITGSNVNASPEAGEPATVVWSVFWDPTHLSPLGSNSVWWVLTPNETSTVDISTLGSSFDTQLGVYTGPITNLEHIISNDDEQLPPSDGHSAVSFTGIGGQTYHILVDGYDQAQGNIVMTISGLTAVGLDPSPGVTIKSPVENQHFTKGQVVVSGTAITSNRIDPIIQVLVYANASAPVVARGIKNWQATVTLAPGTNTIFARSISSTGAESTNAARQVGLAILTPLTIQTNGLGRVTPNMNGKRVYTWSNVKLTALPGTDFLFTGWTGATNSTNSRLSFAMQDNAVLTANFVPDPIAPLRGTFTGLIFDASAPSFQNSGIFNLTLTRGAAFSGRATMGGAVYPFSGRFDTNGAASFAVTRRNVNGTFQLDLTGGSDQVTGTINANGVTATILGDRAVLNARTNPAPTAGSYTLDFPRNDVVQGDGFGLTSVEPSGVLTLSGKLADGTTINQRVPVSKSRMWPLYVPLYRNLGALTGWVQITNEPFSSLRGDVHWYRPAQARSAFPAGFALDVPVIGSLFIQPPRGTPILNWTNGIALAGDNSSMTPLTNAITFNPNNTIRGGSLKLSVDSRGSVKGSFVHPITQRTETFQGAALQKTNWIGGFFTDNGNVGSFFAGPVVSPDSPVITPLSTLSGAVLTISPTATTGRFKALVPQSFSFDTTVFTTGVAGFGGGTYDFSSYASSSENIAELNLVGGTIAGRKSVIRMLLNFADATSGTFNAQLNPASMGTASGTFQITTP